MNATSHQNLIEWLKKDLELRGHFPVGESSAWLVEETERAIRRYLGRENPPRPSAVVRELASLARHLEGAARAARRLGRPGFLIITAASGSTIEDEDADDVRHILYLEGMAALSEEAKKLASEQSRSIGDGRGGPTPEQRLRQLTAYLLQSYQQHLNIRPMHTIDKETGLAERSFTGFVKQALRYFAPEGVVFEPRLIDGVVRELLPIRASRAAKDLGAQKRGS